MYVRPHVRPIAGDLPFVMILSPFSVRVVAVALGIGAGLSATGCATNASLVIPKTQADAANG